MWWKLAGLGLLGVSYVALLCMPIATVDIRVDMPAPSSDGSIDPEAMFSLVMMFAGFIAAAVAIAVPVLIGWLMWRVIRHHRSQKA